MLCWVVGAVWLLAVFPAGALRGARASGLVLRAGLVGTATVVFGVLAWAVLDGQWAGFVSEFGASALLEMGTFVVIFWFISYYLGSRYHAGKLAEERRRAGGGADA